MEDNVVRSKNIEFCLKETIDNCIIIDTYQAVLFKSELDCFI